MELFPREALNPGVGKREVFGWAMYDFANSGYTTVVLTAVFGAYFVGSVAGGQPWATLAWSAALAASNVVVMLTMPALGAYADLKASKKRLLMLSTAGCVAATASLAAVGPGDVALAVAAVLLSNVFYTYGESLSAAFLPELAREDSIGRVSGWGWSLGYCGGMLTLGLSLAHALWAQRSGLAAPQFVPVTMLITAGIFAAASLPAFALLRERSSPARLDGGRPGLSTAMARLRRTCRQARCHRDLVALLACTAAYQSGVSAVVALAAVYAEQVMHFAQTQTMLLVFLVNIAAAAGAFGCGYLQDRIGHRFALGTTLAGWIVMTLLAALATGPGQFWVAGALAGLCMGSSQSTARALVGLFSPAAQRAEFYGLWTFSIHLSAAIGPLTYGLVTWLSDGNHRLGIVSTAVFFVLGLALLVPIDVARGIAAARGGAARQR